MDLATTIAIKEAQLSLKKATAIIEYINLHYPEVLIEAMKVAEFKAKEE